MVRVGEQKPASNKRKSRPSKRDIKQELFNAFGSAEGLHKAIADMAPIHLRPLAKGYKRRLKWVKAVWIQCETFRLQSKKRALATLAKGAPFPDTQVLKTIIIHIAKKGKSRFKGRIGWSYTTTRTFFARHLVTLPTKQETSQLFNALLVWAKEENLLHTECRPKCTVRFTDLNELITACFNAGLGIHQNVSRLKLASFFTFLYTHGSRPGSVVESDAHKASGECLLWEDLEFVIYGHEPGLGLGLQAFVTFNWMKGQRTDKSKFVRSSMRTLGRQGMHVDSLLMLVALGIISDVFAEDVVQFFADPSNLPATPFKLHYKPGKEKQPVWLSAKGDGPMTQSGMQNMMDKVRKLLGWQDFTMRSLRYGWAYAMMSILPEYHAKYLLGHTFNSNHGQTTYQAPDRPVDVSGARFGETSYNGLSEYRSSVAWSRTESQLEAKVTDERLVLDPRMAVLIQNVKDTERLVVKKYGCMSNDVTDQYLEDDLVSKAFNAWAECLMRYQEMATEASPLEDITRQFSSISLSKPSRLPAEGSSTVHRPRQSGRLEAPVPVLKEPVFRPEDVKLGAPSNVRQVLALEDVEDAVMDALDNFDTSHPFISLIDNEPHNPRYFVLMQYLGLAKKDELHSAGFCPHCFATKTDPKVRFKVHKNYSQHVWGCEQSSTPNSWKCPVCAELLRCKADEDWETKELEIAFEEHCRRCRDILLIKCGQMDPPKDSMDVEEEEEEEPADPSEIKTLLYIESRVEGSRKHCKHNFCPLCVFDAMCSRPLKRKPFKAPELIYFSSEKGLREHLGTHWTNGKDAGVLKYDHEYICGFRNCGDTKQVSCRLSFIRLLMVITRLSTKEIIEHLHVKHNYNLLLCTLDHEEHTDACFALEDEFQWEEDAALRDELNGTVTSPVLIEARRKAVKEKARALIHADAGSTSQKVPRKGKARVIADSTDDDSDSAPRRAVKGKARVVADSTEDDDDSEDDKAPAIITSPVVIKTPPRRAAKGKAPIRHVIADSTDDDDDKAPISPVKKTSRTPNVDSSEESQDDSEDDEAPRTPETEHDLAYYIRQFDPDGSIVSQHVIDKMAEEELTLQLIADMSAKDFKDLDMGLVYGRFKRLQTFITDVLRNGV